MKKSTPFPKKMLRVLAILMLMVAPTLLFALPLKPRQVYYAGELPKEFKQVFLEFGEVSRLRSSDLLSGRDLLFLNCADLGEDGVQELVNRFSFTGNTLVLYNGTENDARFLEGHIHIGAETPNAFGLQLFTYKNLRNDHPAYFLNTPKDRDDMAGLTVPDLRQHVRSELQTHLEMLENERSSWDPYYIKPVVLEDLSCSLSPAALTSNANTIPPWGSMYAEIHKSNSGTDSVFSSIDGSPRPFYFTGQVALYVYEIDTVAGHYWVASKFGKTYKTVNYSKYGFDFHGISTITMGDSFLTSNSVSNPLLDESWPSEGVGDLEKYEGSIAKNLVMEGWIPNDGRKPIMFPFYLPASMNLSGFGFTKFGGSIAFFLSRPWNSLSLPLYLIDTNTWKGCFGENATFARQVAEMPEASSFLKLEILNAWSIETALNDTLRFGNKFERIEYVYFFEDKGLNMFNYTGHSASTPTILFNLPGILHKSDIHTHPQY